MYSPKRRFRLFRTFTTVDALRLQLTTSLTTYDAAAPDNWISITSTEYANIFSNVTGVTKRGNNDTQLQTRDVLVAFTEVQFSDPADDNTPITINAGEYAIAFVAETWNQTGTVQFGTTTAFHTGAPSYGNSLTINPVQRNYYLRKAPTTAASQTLYPAIKSTNATNGFLCVANTRGWYTNNSGTSWAATAPIGVGTPKFQMMVTSTKSW